VNIHGGSVRAGITPLGRNALAKKNETFHRLTKSNGWFDIKIMKSIHLSNLLPFNKIMRSICVPALAYSTTLSK